MHVIDIGPISNNPQTSYKLVFGHKVSIEQVLGSLKQLAEMRQKLGFTTEEHTQQTLSEAKLKIETIISN